MTLVKGKWYWVTWVDAASGSGDVASAVVALRRLPLKFHSWAMHKHREVTVRYARFGCLDEEDRLDYTDSDWWALSQRMIVSTKEIPDERQMVDSVKGDRVRGRDQGSNGA